MWTRRRFLKTVGALPVAGLVGSLPIPLLTPASSAAAEDALTFSDGGHTAFGDWRADVKLSPSVWSPGAPLRAEVFLHLSPALIPALLAAGIPVDALLMLVTSERTFDTEGWLRLPGDERMSTLLTPTGLAIEGGNTGSAISKTTGSRYRNPVDQIKRVPVGDLLRDDSSQWARFLMETALPADIPPGLYRLRFDFGIIATRRYLSLNNESFGYRPRYPDKDRSLLYSPVIACNGPDVNGQVVDATTLRRRIYWVLLGQYSSNGYYGVVADEDRDHFALSDRNIIPDEVILPLSTYNLEPDFRADLIDEQRNIPWNYASGELSIQVTDPKGNSVDLGTAPFKEKRNNRPTTGNPRFTAWKPSMYGRYTVVAKGWIADRWGNRYEGGGTYHFWIAKRMTMATATFQGQPYAVGSRYGRDIAFAPAVPADVTVRVDLYPNSDPTQVKTSTYSGKATRGGIFGAAQGMVPFVLDAPGEYHAHVLATYTDSDGVLWVCSMRHAGVVYPLDSRLIAHGKKLRIRGSNQLVDRGESHYEGYVEPDDGFRNLDHIDFPYNAGDVLLIASEVDGANKIEPMLSYEIKESGQPYDPRIQPIGYTNVRVQTSNGMSPHLYPEYITEKSYFYAAGPRPGFMSRFLVGEDGVRAPYWPTSATSFGGQIGASSNGDLPGTIYRLIGGVVVHFKDQWPMYAGYMASAFVIPGGSNNNRVIAPGSEDLLGADGKKHRFFLVSVRPGMVYEQGAAFAPAFQIDPILPVHIRCVLRAPDGAEKVWEGTGDGTGSFAATDRVTMDQPGVWVYTVESDWEGHPGHVPGLPEEGGYLFVIPKTRPEGAGGLRLALKNQQSFTVEEGLLVEGFSNADKVWFAAVMPGTVVDQGVLPVDSGRFAYRFDPVAISQKMPFYDVVNVRTGRKELGRVIHLTFLAEQKAPDGSPYCAFARVVFRGSTAIYTS